MAKKIERKTGVPILSITYDGTTAKKNAVVIPYLTQFEQVGSVWTEILPWLDSGKIKISNIDIRFRLCVLVRSARLVAHPGQIWYLKRINDGRPWA